MDRIVTLSSQRAVVVFSISSCCMCHAIKTLLSDLGCSPLVYEIDEEPAVYREMKKALARLVGRKTLVPVVFIGGRLVGSTEQVMSLHLGGNLVPLLRQAGAVWL